MNFRPLPQHVNQGLLRREVLSKQSMNAQTHAGIAYYIEQIADPDTHPVIRASAYNAARTLQGILRERSAEERYMRGLHEGLVLDDPGPACSVCGGHSNVVHMGGSIPYLCDNPECIPF